ncbi:MAG: alpha-galactosidase [Candidatus Thermoplasmatota archaeon]|nr:alpha-galactosidase [Candidatus Thermoplasmatota archaeon]
MESRIGLAAISAFLMVAVLFSGCAGEQKYESEGSAVAQTTFAEQVGDELKIKSGLLDISANLEKGTFDFFWNYGAKIENCVAEAEIDGNRICTSEYEQKSLSESAIVDKIGAARSVEILFSSSGKPDIVEEIRIYPGTDYATVRLSVVNTLSSPITVTAIRPLDADPENGGNIGFTLPEGPVLALMNGYQLWDYAGVVRILGTPLGNMQYYYDTNTIYTADTTGWWVQSLYDEIGKKTVTAGAITCEKWKTKIFYNSTFQMESNWYVECGGNGEKLEIAPGEKVSSEIIYIGSSGNNLNELEEYAKIVGIQNGATQKEAPKGWCSWYYYFDSVTEDGVLSNANAIKEKLGGVGYQYIQIDDGWQKFWGDWTPNEKFPDGMDGTAKKIREMGFKPGIWLAPFLVRQELPIAQEHPDWFVKSEDGSYVTYAADDGTPHLCLDATHPGAQEWMREIFRNVKQWGYEYIKIDFLVQGAYEGVHYDKSATGISSLTEGLKIIREVMGDETYFLECGPPVLPGVGIADANRIAEDTCFYGLPQTLQYTHGIMSWPQLVWSARNVAARYFLGGNVYQNDPDVVVVRQPYTADEARTQATVCALAGGVLMLGDNIAELPDDRLEILKNSDVYSLAKGKSARPVDLFEHWDLLPGGSVICVGYRFPGLDTLPKIWYMPIDEKTCAVGIFNWGNVPEYATFDFSKIDRGEGNYKVYDMWTGSELGEYSGSYSTLLMPHASQLVKIVG